MKTNKIKQKMKPLNDVDLIERLSTEKQLTINNKNEAVSFFNKYSYTEIKIYKDVFYDFEMHKYKKGISLENIIALHEFDTNVKLLMIKYIMKFEKHLKKVFVEMILSKFEDVNYQMLNEKKLYIKNDEKFFKLKEDILKMTSKYKKFYSSYDENIALIPCWALLDKFTFGMLQSYYDLLTNECKMFVAKKFNILYSDFSVYLNTISTVRNKSAHGDMLIISKFPYLKSNSDKIYDKLGISLIEKDNNLIREYGINDFYSVLIIFKKILGKDEFGLFYNEFNKLFKKLKKKCNSQVIEKIIEKMHMPKKWGKINEI